VPCCGLCSYVLWATQLDRPDGSLRFDVSVLRALMVRSFIKGEEPSLSYSLKTINVVSTLPVLVEVCPFLTHRSCLAGRIISRLLTKAFGNELPQRTHWVGTQCGGALRDYRDLPEVCNQNIWRFSCRSPCFQYCGKQLRQPFVGMQSTLILRSTIGSFM
jgi:hypothetical protein